MGNNTLTPHDLRLLRSKYDVNKDNRLAFREVQQLVKEITAKEGLSQPFPDAPLKQLFQSLDKDGNGYISFDEFDGACWVVLQQQRQHAAKAKGKGAVRGIGKGTGKGPTKGQPAVLKQTSPPATPKAGMPLSKANATPKARAAPSGSRVAAKARAYPAAQVGAKAGAVPTKEELNAAATRIQATQRGKAAQREVQQMRTAVGGAATSVGGGTTAGSRALGAAGGPTNAAVAGGIAAVRGGAARAADPGATSPASGAELSRLRRRAVEKGMLFKDANSKGATELQHWLMQHDAAPIDAPKAAEAVASARALPKAADAPGLQAKAAISKAATGPKAKARAKTEAKASTQAKLPATSEMDAAAAKIQATYRGRATRQQLAQAKAQTKARAKAVTPAGTKAASGSATVGGTTRAGTAAAATAGKPLAASDTVTSEVAKVTRTVAATGAACAPAGATTAFQPTVAKAVDAPAAVVASGATATSEDVSAASAQAQTSGRPLVPPRRHKVDRGLIGDFDVGGGDLLGGWQYLLRGGGDEEEALERDQRQQRPEQQWQQQTGNQQQEQQTGLGFTWWQEHFPSSRGGAQGQDGETDGAADQSGGAAQTEMLHRKSSSAYAVSRLMLQSQLPAAPLEEPRLPPVERRFPWAPQLREQLGASSDRESQGQRAGHRDASANTTRRQALTQTIRGTAMQALQGPGATALMPQEPSELSEPESQESAESISGDVSRSWDPAACDCRYLYARDRAVEFSEPWQPLVWTQEDWERTLQASGSLAPLERRRDLEARRRRQRLSLFEAREAEGISMPRLLEGGGVARSRSVEEPEPVPMRPSARYEEATGESVIEGAVGARDAELEQWNRWRWELQAQARAVEQPARPSVDPGSLSVTVVAASSLVRSGLDLSIDPYVKLRVGQTTKETKVISGTDNPVWGETLEFRGIHGREVVTATVWDKDLSGLGEDSLLGRLDFELSHLRPRLLAGHRVPLQEFLRHQLLPHGQARLRLELSLGQAESVTAGPWEAGGSSSHGVAALEGLPSEAALPDFPQESPLLDSLRAQAAQEYKESMRQSHQVPIPSFPPAIRVTPFPAFTSSPALSAPILPAATVSATQGWALAAPQASPGTSPGRLWL